MVMTCPAHPAAWPRTPYLITCTDWGFLVDDKIIPHTEYAAKLQALASPASTP